MKQPSVFLVGDIRHRDFTEARRWLETKTSLRAFAKLDDALAALDASHPETIVFAASRRGQISQRQVDQFYAAAPLARSVVLLGSWCEGEQRTGMPLRGVVNIYWHQWTARAATELLSNDYGVAMSWNLPRTTTPGERILHQSDTALPQSNGLVGVDAASLITFEGLSAACDQGGFATVWLKKVHASAIGGLNALIWDSVSCDERSVDRLSKLSQRHRRVPVLAMLDFVRRQDYDNAMRTGAAAVLAKPFLIADLLWHLRHMTDSAGSAAAAVPHHCSSTLDTSESMR